MSDNQSTKAYAVIRTGGKQYRVSEGDILRLEKLEADDNGAITITDILALDAGKGLVVTAAELGKASVELELLRQMRSRKIVVFKKKRRQNYRRRNTHRQELTEVRVKAINAA